MCSIFNSRRRCEYKKLSLLKYSSPLLNHPASELKLCSIVCLPISKYDFNDYTMYTWISNTGRTFCNKYGCKHTLNSLLYLVARSLFEV